MINDQEHEFKISDAKALELKEYAESKGAVFSPTMSVDELQEVMGWVEIPWLAKKSYNYDMRKILGQLSKKELKNLEKREAKDLQVKRGRAKIRQLMDRAL